MANKSRMPVPLNLPNKKCLIAISYRHLNTEDKGCMLLQGISLLNILSRTVFPEFAAHLVDIHHETSSALLAQ